MDGHSLWVMNALGPTEIGATDETTEPMHGRSVSCGVSLCVYLSGSRNRRSETAISSDSLKSSGYLHLMSEWDDPTGKLSVLFGPIQRDFQMMPYTKWVLPYWTPSPVEIPPVVGLNGPPWSVRPTGIRVGKPQREFPRAGGAPGPHAPRVRTSARRNQLVDCR